MLATLGGAGASMFSPLTGHDEPTPVTAATAEAVTVEAVTAEADAVEQSVAQDTDVEQIVDIPDLAEELLAEADGKAGPAQLGKVPGGPDQCGPAAFVVACADTTGPGHGSLAEVSRRASRTGVSLRSAA
jgi:hypothetical protein